MRKKLFTFQSWGLSGCMLIYFINVCFKLFSIYGFDLFFFILLCNNSMQLSNICFKIFATISNDIRLRKHMGPCHLSCLFNLRQFVYICIFIYIYIYIYIYIIHISIGQINVRLSVHGYFWGFEDWPKILTKNLGKILVAEWLRHGTLGKKVAGSTPQVDHQGTQVDTAYKNPCLSSSRSVHIQLVRPHPIAIIPIKMRSIVAIPE